MTFYFTYTLRGGIEGEVVKISSKKALKAAKKKGNLKKVRRLNKRGWKRGKLDADG